MPAALEFVLGLNNAPFMTAMNGAGMAVRKFFDLAAGGAGAIGDKVWGQIEKGANLDVLARRTGMAAGEINTLQKAFAAAGVDGGAVASIMNRMQMALSGVGEMGQKTSDAFAALGLDIGSLKGQNPTQVFEQIITAMAKLSHGDQMKAGMSIFGRMGAMEATTIAGSAEEVAEAMHRAAETQNFWNTMAKPMHEMDESWERVKNKLQVVWANIAAGLLPAMQSFANLLDRISLGKFAEELRRVMTTLYAAASNGDLGEAISLSLEMAVEGFTVSFVAALDFIGKQAWRAFNHIGSNAMVSFFESEMQNEDADFWRMLGITPAGVAQMKKDLPGEQAAEWSKSAGEFKQMPETMKYSFSPETQARLAALQTKYADQIAGMMAGSPRAVAGGAAASGLTEFEDKKAAKEPQVNALERIGAIFGGGAIAVDYARQTAQNTARLVDRFCGEQSFGRTRQWPGVLSYDNE